MRSQNIGHLYSPGGIPSEETYVSVSTQHPSSFHAATTGPCVRVKVKRGRKRKRLYIKEDGKPSGSFDFESGAPHRPAKRRKREDQESRNRLITHNPYVPRKDRGTATLRRVTTTAEEMVIQDPHRGADANAEEFEEELIQVQALLSDDEEEDEGEGEGEGCVGCLLIQRHGKHLPVVNAELVETVDRIMFSGVKTGSMIKAAKHAALEFNGMFVDVENLTRNGSHKIPYWGWKSIRKHYVENHIDNPEMAMYSSLNQMAAVVRGLVKHELCFYENTGELTVDVETGTKKREFVKRVRLPVAKTVHTMNRDIITLRMKIIKERQILREKNAENIVTDQISIFSRVTTLTGHGSNRMNRFRKKSL